MGFKEVKVAEGTQLFHLKDSSLLPGSRERSSSFHVSGTPGRHQWLQSDVFALSPQRPTCASLRNADKGVMCTTVTGTAMVFTTSNIMSENGLLSSPLVSERG